MNPFSGTYVSVTVDTYGRVTNTVPPPTFSPVMRNKCVSCGSREFKKHGDLLVCAYCRSTT
jgi:hypothetical protein